MQTSGARTTGALCRRRPSGGCRPFILQVEARVRWPRQVLHNVVVFLGKPAVLPSERPITLTSGLYRLWCKLRRPQVQEWEAAAAGYWDRAIAGSSALQAALRRELRHEVGDELGTSAQAGSTTTWPSSMIRWTRPWSWKRRLPTAFPCGDWCSA